MGWPSNPCLGPPADTTRPTATPFLRLPWSVKQQQNLLEQWDKCVYLPQVPGGYFIDRNLTNAFRQVVIMNKNPRETLLDYNKEINQEISRKRKEFHLE